MEEARRGSKPGLLEDLANLDEDMLRDAGCKELHRRRFRAAVNKLPTQPRGQVENIGCGGSADFALRRAGLDQFADGLRGQLGIVEAAHLLELKREDLVGLGFKTLHRRRFYQLVEPLRACPVDGKGSQLRKEMRRAVMVKTLHQLHLAVRAEQLRTTRKRPLSAPPACPAGARPPPASPSLGRGWAGGSLLDFLSVVHRGGGGGTNKCYA